MLSSTPAIRHRYGSDGEHFGELRRPAAATPLSPLVVLIHGGFWRDRYRLDLMDPLADHLAAAGIPSWNIEYRRVGPTGGGWDTTTSDVAAAVDYIVARQEWPALAVVGHSAGGHLALWNASRRDAAQHPALTVGLAPVADVVLANQEGTGVDATPDFFGGSAEEVPERYSAAQPDPSAFTGRVMLVHGDADTNVPVHQSSRLADVVDRCEILTDVDHFDVIDPGHHSWVMVMDEITSLTTTT